MAAAGYRRSILLALIPNQSFGIKSLHALIPILFSLDPLNEKEAMGLSKQPIFIVSPEHLCILEKVKLLY